MTIDMCADGIGAIAEDPAMLLIIAELGGFAQVVTRTATARAGRTVAGACAVFGRGRRFGSAIAGNGEVALWDGFRGERGFQAQFAEEVFQAGVQFVRLPGVLAVFEQGITEVF